MASAEQAVLDLFESLYRSVCEQRDADEGTRLWAGDADIAMVGSGLDEVAFGSAAVHSLLQGIAAADVSISFEWSQQRVHVEGDVAWVNAAGVLTVDGDASDYRTTAIFVRREGRWLWHTHAGSEPHPT